LLGNITCMIAAYRIAVSNGWTLSELNPLPKRDNEIRGIATSELTPLRRLTPYPLDATESSLLIKLFGLTAVTSYAVKYGELGMGSIPFDHNPVLAAGAVLTIPAIVAASYYSDSPDLQATASLPLPKEAWGFTKQSDKVVERGAGLQVRKASRNRIEQAKRLLGMRGEERMARSNRPAQNALLRMNRYWRTNRWKRAARSVLERLRALLSRSERAVGAEALSPAPSL